MDLFNNKKLIEKEGEIHDLNFQIQRLETTIKQLKQELSNQESQLNELEEEKGQEAKLHQNVVDTMLGEIQELIVDNNHKDLIFRTLDTLFPLVKDLIDTQKFTVNVAIYLPSLFSRVGKKRKQELLLAYCKNITDKWESIGLVEKTVVDDVFTDFINDPVEGCVLKIFSKFTPDEFIYRMKGISAMKYSLISGDFLMYVKDIRFEKKDQINLVQFSYDFKHNDA